MSRRSVVAAMVALVGGVLVMAGSASAQTGYPPGPCAATVSAANIGNFNVGTTFTVTLSPTCAWTAGTPVTVTVNGQDVGIKNAVLDGTVAVTVRIVSATLLEIDDPVEVPAICGLNTVVASGASTVAQANVVHTVNFGVVCPAQAVRSGIAFTGANILRMAAAALVAVLLGSMLVSANRKRRQRVAEPVS